jgi:hypothetical protein
MDPHDLVSRLSEADADVAPERRLTEDGDAKRHLSSITRRFHREPGIRGRQAMRDSPRGPADEVTIVPARALYTGIQTEE